MRDYFVLLLKLGDPGRVSLRELDELDEELFELRD